MDKIMPVRPPTVKRKMKPRDQRRGGSHWGLEPNKVASQLKTLIPVGTAMIMVAAVK